MNVHDEDGWEDVARDGFRSRRRRLVGVTEDLGGSERLGASVWEVPPGGTQLGYHFHHAQEEFLLVLSGRPTLRTPSGSRELEPGEFVFFARGPSGAHQLSNLTEDVARVLFVSELALVEVAEYPDSGKIHVVARGESQTGDRLSSEFELKLVEDRDDQHADERRDDPDDLER